MTEEEILAANVGAVEPLDAPIALVEYDPENYADAKTDVVREIMGRA